MWHEIATRTENVPDLFASPEPGVDILTLGKFQTGILYSGGVEKPGQMRGSQTARFIVIQADHYFFITKKGNPFRFERADAGDAHGLKALAERG